MEAPFETFGLTYQQLVKREVRGRRSWGNREAVLPARGPAIQPGREALRETSGTVHTLLRDSQQ